MTTRDTEADLQTILMIVEALAYLGLALWCLNRAREGRWALLAVVGTGLVGLVLGLSAAALAEAQFLDSYHLFEKVFFREHATTAFTVARVAGVLLLVWGFVLSRRTPPAPTAAIYGPS